MSEERYVRKFALCAIISFFCLVASAVGWGAQGFQMTGTAFTAVVLNAVVVVAALLSALAAAMLSRALD